jgi:exo-beta-1,3-glucanase (GH17 family)
MSKEKNQSLEVTKNKLTRREFIQAFFVSFFGAGLAYNKTAQATKKYDVYLPMIANSSRTGIKGLCYGPYREGQDPNTGPHPSEREIKEDVDILGNISETIRTYGSNYGLENIPRYIQQKGIDININAGSWLGQDNVANNDSIANLITETKQYPNINSVTVGHETQSFNLITENELINYINHVKQNVHPGVTVTTGETWYEWTRRPALANSVDYISADFFPYWDAVRIENAINFIDEKYKYLQYLYPEKRIVIGEAGWPSSGEAYEGVIPSIENQKRFVEELVVWANKNQNDIYLLEAFDQPYKEKSYGTVAGSSGIYYSNRNPKHPGLSLK